MTGDGADRPGAIVIGAGIVGLSAAEWLRRAGASVTLVDRVRPGGPGQTSYGNAGILARSSFAPNSKPGLFLALPRLLLDPGSPFFLRWRRLPAAAPWLARFLAAGRRDRALDIARALAPLVEDSVEQHLALSEGTAARALIRQGRWAYLYRDRKTFEGDPFAWSIRRDHGVTWREIDRAELLAEDPDLGADFGFAAALDQHGWLTDPGRYVALLTEHFEREGGRFCQGEAVDLRPNADGPGATVVLRDGSISAERVVLACGAWSGALARRIGHRPLLESERGYHMQLSGASHAPPYPYMIADAAVVATPMEAGPRFAGLLEIGGLEAGPSAAPLRLLERQARRLYPTIAWDKAETWLGHRPGPPDSLPFIGESPRAPGVYFAFGAHHVGLTSGPKTGRIIADLALRRTPNLDLAAYRPDRFD